MKTLALIAGTIAIFGVTITMGNQVVKKQETKECLQWQAQSQEYPNFYLNSWQSKQCKARGVQIN